MADDPYRYAAPTGNTPKKDGATAWSVAGPHGEAWMRSLSPIDATNFNATGAINTVPTGYSTYPSAPGIDLVALSKARKSDSNGDGTGVGRRASGFLAADSTGGTVVFTTGSGQVETWVVPAGGGASVEMTHLAAYSGTNLIVFW
jgi:hypothetical protein